MRIWKLIERWALFGVVMRWEIILQFKLSRLPSSILEHTLQDPSPPPLTSTFIWSFFAYLQYGLITLGPGEGLGWWEGGGESIDGIIPVRINFIVLSVACLGSNYDALIHIHICSHLFQNN